MDSKPKQLEGFVECRLSCKLLRLALLALDFVGVGMQLHLEVRIAGAVGEVFGFHNMNQHLKSELCNLPKGQ